MTAAIAEARGCRVAHIEKRAIAAAQKDNYEEALKLFRDAYRIDRNPRWQVSISDGHLYVTVADQSDAFSERRSFGWGATNGSFENRNTLAAMARGLITGKAPPPLETCCPP